MDIKKIIGRNIKTARTVNGITQEDLAKRVGICQSNLSNVESGNSNIKVELLQKFADSMNVSVTSLVMNTKPSQEEVKLALDFALEEYDKETILDIMQHEEAGWSEQAELLNYTDVETVRTILYS